MRKVPTNSTSEDPILPCNINAIMPWLSKSCCELIEGEVTQSAGNEHKC